MNAFLLASVPLPTPSPSATAAASGGIGLNLGFGDYLGLGVTLLIALLGSRVLATWLSGWLERSSRTRQFNRKDARKAMLALKKARGVYLRYGTHPTPNAVDEKRDLALVEASNDVIATAALTSNKPVLESAKEYVRVGELFASGDEDTSVTRESEAFFDLIELLRGFTS